MNLFCVAFLVTWGLVQSTRFLFRIGGSDGLCVELKWGAKVLEWGGGGGGDLVC